MSSPFCVVVLGTTMTTIVVLQIEIGTITITATTITGFVLPILRIPEFVFFFEKYRECVLWSPAKFPVPE